MAEKTIKQKRDEFVQAALKKFPDLTMANAWKLAVVEYPSTKGRKPKGIPDSQNPMISEKGPAKVKASVETSTTEAETVDFGCIFEPDATIKKMLSLAALPVMAQGGIVECHIVFDPIKKIGNIRLERGPATAKLSLEFGSKG